MRLTSLTLTVTNCRGGMLTPSWGGEDVEEYFSAVPDVVKARLLLRISVSGLLIDLVSYYSGD